MTSLRRLAMEFWCGVGDPAEAARWADREYETDPEPHPRTVDVYSKVPHTVGVALLEIAAAKDGFDPWSRAGEAEAIAILTDRAERLLAGEIEPDDFCRLVARLDAAAGDPIPENRWITWTDERTFTGGDWLGDLWNCCDGCDETWTRAGVKALLDEAARVVAANRGRGPA